MSKTFLISGFLYHPETQQILLQRESSETSDSSWSLLSCKAPSAKESKQSFKHTLMQVLNLDISESNIHQVYNYDESEEGNNNAVAYAVVEELTEYPTNKGNEFGWFTQKEISKLKLPFQTKQDITVGQRVIDSSIRRDAGVLTIG